MSAPTDLKMEPPKRAERVRAMFSAIAPTYDRLNHLLSLNRDRAWRRVAVSMLQLPPGERLLDLCGGTGDVAIECLRQQPELGRLVVADFSIEMLRRAQEKFAPHARRVGQESPTCNSGSGRSADTPTEPRPPTLHAADALRLPYLDDSFDAVTVAFGVRNFEDTERGVREIMRVLRPGGRMLVLEFFRPTSAPMKFAFGQFFRRVMPLVGRVVSGHAFAYSYLPESVGAFMTLGEFETLLQRMGLHVASVRHLDGGMACAVLSVKSQISNLKSQIP